MQSFITMSEYKYMKRRNRCNTLLEPPFVQCHKEDADEQSKELEEVIKNEVSSLIGSGESGTNDNKISSRILKKIKQKSLKGK